MKVNSKALCRCGHVKAQHTATSATFIYCHRCYNERGELASIHDFILDNLEYLRMKHEEK